MKKLLVILVLGLLWCNVGYAFCSFCCVINCKKGEYSMFDPSVSGCVYDSYGKQGCITVPYNAKKGRTIEDAERMCVGFLKDEAREEGRTNYTIKGC